MTRADVVAEALSWKDTPWRHQACVKGVGADCLHYIAGVDAHFGSPEAAAFFAKPEWHSYGRHPDPDMMFAGCDELMDRIEPSDALPGDVFVLTCGKHPMHFAFLLDDERIAHAYLGAGRVVVHGLDAKWRKRIIRAYRLRGIE